jgi:hypothetical protein
MRYLLIVIALGLTGCVRPAPDSAVCAGLDRPVADLRRALVAHPATPEPVGEAGTDVVLGFEAGCRS